MDEFALLLLFLKCSLLFAAAGINVEKPVIGSFAASDSQ